MCSGETYRVQIGVNPVTAANTPPQVELCFLGLDADNADNDLLPDCIDPCTDSDFDGYGDDPLETRPFDNCQSRRKPH